MGEGFGESALLTLTFLTQYLLDENPYFCELLLKGKKDFQSFPHSLYMINCTKSIQNRSHFLLTNQCKIFVKLSSSIWFPERKGEKKIKVSSEIKTYPLFFNTQKLIASEDVWEHFLSSNISVLAIKSCLLSSFLTNWHPAGFSCILYPLKSCNTCCSAFSKLAEFVD